jgi:hypothetical protein
MAISRAQLAKELEPGLNALFGMEYSRYENQHAEIFTTESSDRAFEEEVMLSGFGAAPTKSEGSAISFDDAQEAYTARYNHETVALAFSITEEAIEDNLYDRLGSRYTRALARSMAHTKQVKAASILNDSSTSSGLRCQLTWKRTSTQATCVSKLVSVTASDSRIHAVCSDLLAQHK